MVAADPANPRAAGAHRRTNRRSHANPRGRIGPGIAAFEPWFGRVGGVGGAVNFEFEHVKENDC